MSAHRVLKDLFRGFESNGPGIGVDPGDAGTIAPDLWAQQFPIVTAGIETRTLAQPSNAGIITSVCLDTDGGDMTLTVTGGYNNDDDTSIVFDDAGDLVVFMSIKEGSSYYWRAIHQEGTTAQVSVGDVQSLTGAAAIAVDGSVSVASIDSGGAYAITLAAPSAAMRGKTLVIEYSQGATDAVTLALTNVQGGSAATSASFNADNETLILVGGESKWNVIKEVGVTLT